MKKHKKGFFIIYIGSQVFLENGGILLKGSCFETVLLSDKNTIDQDNMNEQEYNYN